MTQPPKQPDTAKATPSIVCVCSKCLVINEDATESLTAANARIAELEEQSIVQLGIERTIREQRDELQRKLSKFQESEFHPDWSMLDASRASLREHMYLLKESQSANAKLQANVARLEIYESIALTKERQEKEK